MSTGSSPDFDARARDYDTLRPADIAWRERFDALVELGDLRGRRVLDVGCGTGRLAAALATEARAKVWAVDASAEMVAVAQETVPPGVGVRRGTAEQLPFRDGWFDRLTMSLMIHLVDRQRTLAEARRVLGAGGRLAIATFHPDHFLTYWLNPFFPSIRSIDEDRFPTPALLEQELREAGFLRYESRRIVTEVTIGREEALVRVRGRHISTFDLLSAAEIEDGTAKAEQELPPEISTRLDQLIVVGHVG